LRILPLNNDNGKGFINSLEVSKNILIILHRNVSKNAPWSKRNEFPYTNSFCIDDAKYLLQRWM